MNLEILEDRQGWYEDYQANWLRHYQETGETLWKIYQRPRNTTAPSGKAINLSESRLVLITSAGSYLKDEQTPYDAENDLGAYDIRLYSSSTPLNKLAYAHTHYDHTAVNADPQVLVPLLHLDDLVSEGVVGELAPNVISFMGYQPDVMRVLDETIPAIITAMKAENAQAALLVPS
ncbi:MAG: glycine/sarcosine/betaine reductase selenoprotein B family protein [Aggregatilineales bacterium]